MSDLIKKDSAIAPINQYGDKIINIEHAGNVHYHSQIFMVPSNTLPGMPGFKLQERKISCDYYNLIVYGDDPSIFMQQGHITLSKDRCLVKDDYIAPELKEKYYRLTEENIKELTSFPCIFASENKYYGKTDDGHSAIVGYLKDIKIRSNGVELYCDGFILGISQARLNEVLPTFGICGKYKRYNELNHSHWSVKAINLSEAINDTGMNLI